MHEVYNFVKCIMQLLAENESWHIWLSCAMVDTFLTSGMSQHNHLVKSRIRTIMIEMSVSLKLPDTAVSLRTLY